MIAVLVILLIIAAILFLDVVADYSENFASAFPQLLYDLDGLPITDLIVRNNKDRSIAFGCYDGSVNDAAKPGGHRSAHSRKTLSPPSKALQSIARSAALPGWGDTCLQT